jgi:ribonuclease HII
VPLRQSKAQNPSQHVDPAEKLRLECLTLYEREARERGFRVIAGIDEAGRGPLAGPVVAAACIIPEGFFFYGIDDSKKLSEDKRERLFSEITTNPLVHYAVGIVCHEEIDLINIYQATVQAMLHALNTLSAIPDIALVDGMKLSHLTIPTQKIVGGDAASQSIAAASIIAKQTRDSLMKDYDTRWPEYGFAQHKGYGTKQHLSALQKHGPCPIHRRSFGPVKVLLG